VQKLASGLSFSSIGGGTHLSFWAYVTNLLDGSGPDLIQSRHQVHLEFWVGLYPLKEQKWACLFTEAMGLFISEMFRKKA